MLVIKLPKKLKKVFNEIRAHGFESTEKGNFTCLTSQFYQTGRTKMTCDKLRKLVWERAVKISQLKTSELVCSAGWIIPSVSSPFSHCPVQCYLASLTVSSFVPVSMPPFPVTPVTVTITVTLFPRRPVTVTISAIKQTR